ncbi:hypothetical protein Pla110_32180 [Polystyrenella longa]|uniref:Uncharacterized protein n=1 Tax=Polystyrenella longa TaxID=2528007 RepID=A0A518CQG9_9PLAN|nr:hypothetical protein [Polystyrenella longa]QDU81476.1 hypothetical protein Pla110_32180 [Polystyrenella longa]
MTGSEYASPDDNDQFEQLPAELSMDETDINLRAYLSRLTDDHLQQYQPDWSDKKVIEWDGNFRNNGNLMLVCCERDVDVSEFRRVLEEHIQFRTLSNPAK